MGDQLLSFSCSLKHVSKLQGACKKMQLLNELMDRGGNYVAAALPFIVSLLARGLAGRALLVAHSLPQIPEVMQLSNDPASFAARGVLCVPHGTAGHGEGICGHWEGDEPLWGIQDLRPCTGVWGAAGRLDLGRSPGPVMGQGEDNCFLHQGDLLNEAFPVCACPGT